MNYQQQISDEHTSFPVEMRSSGSETVEKRGGHPTVSSKADAPLFGSISFRTRGCAQQIAGRSFRLFRLFRLFFKWETHSTFRLFYWRRGASDIGGASNRGGCVGQTLPTEHTPRFGCFVCSGSLSGRHTVRFICFWLATHLPAGISAVSE